MTTDNQQIALIQVPPADLERAKGTLSAALLADPEVQKARAAEGALELGEPVIQNELEAQLAISNIKALVQGGKAVQRMEKHALEVPALIIATFQQITRGFTGRFRTAEVKLRNAHDSWLARQEREAAERRRQEEAAAKASVERARAETLDEDLPDMDVAAPQTSPITRSGDATGYGTTRVHVELVDAVVVAQQAKHLLKLDEAAARAYFADMKKRLGEEGVKKLAVPAEGGGVVIHGMRVWSDKRTSVR